MNPIPKIVCSLAVLMFSANSSAESGEVEIVGGKPVVIVFPILGETHHVEKKDFKIETTIYRDVDSGLVTGVWVRSKNGGCWIDSEDVKKILPPWQLPFLKSINEAAKQWRFQKTSAVHLGSAAGDTLDQRLGRNFSFRFEWDAEGLLKIEIADDRGIVADDCP